MEINELTHNQIIHIYQNRLPGGYGIFDECDGMGHTRLNLYRGKHQFQFRLLIETVMYMPSADALVHCEIIDMNRNPELWALYDRDKQEFVASEVFALLDDAYMENAKDDWQRGESVSEPASDQPTPNASIH